MANSLWPNEPQCCRPPSPSTTPRNHPNPCPLSQWCHPAISCSFIPFSSCPESFPASFQMSQIFASGGQSIGISALASFLPITPRTNLQNGLVGSPCSKRDSQESSPTPQFKSTNSLALRFLLVQLSHPYMTTGKTIALTRQTFVGKRMSLLFNT